jgi:hypothetical protein
MSLLRLVLIGEILRAEEPGLVWLADVMQQSGLWHLAEEPLTPPSTTSLDPPGTKVGNLVGRDEPEHDVLEKPQQHLAMNCRERGALA